MPPSDPTALIIARRVAAHRRMAFTPKYFGKHRMLHGEGFAYQWMRRLCRPYQGAYWHFYELSNGGFYMAPDLSGPLRIEVPGNGYRGDLSADATGIVVTLFALSQLMDCTHGQDDCETFIERFHRLRDFAAQHAEADAILAAID
jgi:hypothetical protein